VSGLALVIDSNHQLGTTSSALNTKKYIHNITDDEIARFNDLRPVSYSFKQHLEDINVKSEISSEYCDNTCQRYIQTRKQFGLIADAVAKIYPSVVIKDSALCPDTIRYRDFAAICVAKMQDHAKRLAVLSA
jgi:hypothetical protein